MSEASREIFWLDDGNVWIEGKETWVDLGYVPTRYTSAEFEFCICGPTTRFRSTNQSLRFTQEPIGTPDVIVGHFGTSDSNDWRMFVHGANFTVCADAGNARTETSLKLNETMVWHHCILGMGCYLKIDDLTQQAAFTGSLANSTIKLFSESPTCTSSNTSGDYAWLGFRYVKIFENDVLKMDLVPAKKDGVACFFDKISNNAYFGLNKPLVFNVKELA